LIDAPVDIDHDALHLDPPDKEKIMEVFSELEFRNLLKTVLGEEAQVQAPAAPANEAKGRNSDQMDMFGGGDAEDAGDALHLWPQPWPPSRPRSMTTASRPRAEEQEELAGAGRAGALLLRYGDHQHR
jgi:hypothetical protein